MKKLIIVLAFLGLVTVSYSQNAWKGFFKPMPDTYIQARDYRAATSVWYFRPVVTVTAMRFTYVHSVNPFEVSTFSNMGAGVSYQHFIDVEGAPYNNFGFSALFLFNEYPLGTQPASLSVAGTVNVFQYVNAGIGYDFSQKKVFFLTGVTYSFN